MTFSSLVNNAVQATTKNCQSGGTNSSSLAGTVVQSPFNPLGLPVSTTPAPTAAQVAANPLAYKGTSFDPAIQVKPLLFNQAD